mgnify:FL=1
MLLLGGVALHGQYSAMHEEVREYLIVLQERLVQGSRVSRVEVVKGKPRPGAWGLLFKLYKEGIPENSSKPKRIFEEPVAVCFGQELYKFVRDSDVAKGIHLASMKVYVPSQHADKSIEELLESGR